MSSIQSVSLNAYSNMPMLDSSVPPALDAPKGKSPEAVAAVVAKPTQQEFSRAMYDLLKQTYPRLDRRQSMTAEGQVYKQKRLEAMILKNVLRDLLKLQADPDAAIAKLMAVIQQAQGKGPDAVLNALTATKDQLMTAKVKDVIRSSPTILAGAKESWSDYQRDVKSLVSTMAHYEQYHLRGLASEMLQKITDPEVRAQGWRATQAMQRMVVFSPHDLDRVAEAKEVINKGIKDGAKDGVATLRAAADELHGPALDDLIRQAPSLLTRHPPEEWSKEERRLAALMRSIQRADFDWAASLNNFVIPDTPRRSAA